MPAESWRRWVALIILVAFVARMVTVFALQRWDSPMPGVNRQLAVSLNETGSFTFRDHGTVGPSSITTPVYPVLLATIFAIFGSETPTSYFAALSLNALLGAGAAAAVATAVRRVRFHARGTQGDRKDNDQTPHPSPPHILPAAARDARALTAPATTGSLGKGTGSERIAVAAGLTIALWPPQIFATAFAQPMALAATLAVVACALWARSLWQHGLFTWAAFCFTLVSVALTEPAFMLAVPLAAIAIPFTRAWALDTRVRNVCVLALSCVLLLLPWVARNQAVHGKLLLTTTGWQRVWAGANASATGSDRLPLTPERRASARSSLTSDDSDADVARVPMMQVDALSTARRAALRDQPEAVREGLFHEWAREWIAQNRLAWFAQMPARMLKLWWIDYDHPMSRSPLAFVPRTVGAVGALVGVIILIRRRGAIAMPLLLLVSVLAVASFTIATSKLTMMIEPVQLLLIFAALVPHRAVSRSGDHTSGLLVESTELEGRNRRAEIASRTFRSMQYRPSRARPAH